MQTSRKHNNLKIVKSNIPDNSLIATFLPVDYTDTFACNAPDTGNLTPDNILIAIWTAQPKWITFLFRLRDILVRPFGLKGGSQKESGQSFAEIIRSGGNSGILNVPRKNDNETIMQLKDTHLTMELSVRTESVGENKKNITVTTTVHFHNRLGMVYFSVIRPFHSIIAKVMLKRSINRLNNINLVV